MLLHPPAVRDDRGFEPDLSQAFVHQEWALPEWVGETLGSMAAFQALETGLGIGFLGWERCRNQPLPCLEPIADQTLACSASQTRKASMALVCLVELKPARQAPESGEQPGVWLP